jgi:hypothetical protein
MVFFVSGYVPVGGFCGHGNQLLVSEWCKKAVPLHVTEALGGRGGIAPTHS